MRTVQDQPAFASSPADEPEPPPRGVFGATFARVKAHRLPTLAGGVAFYFMLALFPALIALVTLYGLVGDPASVEEQLASLRGVLPGEAVALVGRRLHAIVAADAGALGFGFVVALAGALLSASSGMKALLEALDVSLAGDARRSFLRGRLLALAWTVGAVLLGGTVLFLAAGLPAAVDALALGLDTERAVTWIRWPAMLLFVMTGLSILYRRGPARETPSAWSVVVPGAFVASLVWVLASAGLSLYVRHLGSYEETYGAIAGVIVTMLWLHLSAFSVLFGAELAGALESRTAVDPDVDWPDGDRRRPARLSEPLPV